MSALPSTGQTRARVIHVNTLSAGGETVHDVKVRLLPREDGVKPIVLRVRDELCSRPLRAGDRLRLTMQVGQVADVEMLEPRKRNDGAGDGDGRDDKAGEQDREPLV
jgi:hypothetical protein